MPGKLFLTLLIFIYFCLADSSNVLADRADKLYEKAAKKYHELYQKTPFGKKSDNWLKTIKQFKIIQKTYPRHPRAPLSLYNIGRLYRSLFQWNGQKIYIDRSNIYFRKLIAEYPESSLSDDAQFLLAENYEIFKQDSNIAYLEYQKLVEQFPDSASVSKALKKLQLLRPTPKDLPITSSPEGAVAPVDMTTIRYGGLAEEDITVDSPQVMVTKVDYWSTTDWSRMVINTRKAVRYKYQVLKEDRLHRQKRMYIDILQSYIPLNFKKTIATEDGLITQARIAQFDKQTVRIVLDMASLEKIKIFNFGLPNQFKIVVDILGKRSLTKLKSRQKPKTPAVSLSKAFGLKVKKIIIDPGHGGKDPGASAFGIKEKDIALKISLALRRIIKQKHANIEVLMTRTKDKFVRLEARTAFANKNKGDLFLSIHLNASLKPKLTGIETYYLNLTSDNEALSLAAKENQTSLKSISDLQSILNDLITNSKIHESSDLAQKVQASTVALTRNTTHKPNNLGVKQAPFIVLLGAQMPSILVEAGFLTNPEENKSLRTTKYRRILAEGIYRGIAKYLK